MEEQGKDKHIGIKLNGVLAREDGRELAWEDFIDMIESNGLFYGGMTQPIDMDTGETVEVEGEE